MSPYIIIIIKKGPDGVAPYLTGMIIGVMMNGPIASLSINDGPDPVHIPFVRKIEHETPRPLGLHQILNNYDIDIQPKVKAWLEHYSRFHMSCMLESR